MARLSLQAHHRTMNNSPGFPPPPTQRHPATQRPPTPINIPTKTANWIGAIAAALAIQIAAAATMVGAFIIVVIAIFSTWGDSSANTPGYIVLALPVGFAGVGLYIFSGRIASRIAGDTRGWLMLLGGPAILLTLRIGMAVLVG